MNSVQIEAKLQELKGKLESLKQDIDKMDDSDEKVEALKELEAIKADYMDLKHAADEGRQIDDMFVALDDRFTKFYARFYAYNRGGVK